MKEKRSLGITFIGYFYIFGAVVLIASLFTNAADQFDIAVRFGLPEVPEKIMRVIAAAVSLIMAYGYLKLEKWGFWFIKSYDMILKFIKINLIFINK